MITSPLDYSGCVVWLDATDTTTLSSLSGGAGNSLINTSLTGDSVGGWGDKSGNGRNFTNIGGSATTRPTWIAALSTVRFDGSNDFLYLSAAQTYTAQTTFVVTAPISFFNLGRIYTQAGDLGTGDLDVYVPLFQNGSTGAVASYTNSSIVAGITQRSLSAFDVMTSLHNGTQLRNFLNGQSSVTQAHALNYTARRHVLGTRIGTTGIAGAYYNGDISEVIVYNRALTNFERADVEYYLTRKWSVLNSIPRQVYALKNGNWSDTTTWSVSGYESPWGFPATIDDVYSNSFTVTADQNAFVQSLRTAALSPNIAAGGTFAITQPNITITASPSGFLAGTTTCVTGLLSTGTSTLSGNVISDSTSPTTAVINVVNQNNGNLTIYGNIRSLGGRDRSGIRNEGGGTITIYGNLSSSNSSGGPVEAVRNNAGGNIVVFGNVTSFGVNDQGGGSHGILNNSVGNVYVTGDVFGPDRTTTVDNTNNNGIRNNSVGSVVINGNIYAGNTIGSSVVFQNSTGTVLINGNIYASPNGHGVVSANAAARNEFTGALFNSDNGRQAVYAARYLLKPKVFESYTYNKNSELVNLLTYSEQFNNAIWTKTNTTVVANVSSNPSDVFTGDRIIETTANSNHTIRCTTLSTQITGLSSTTALAVTPLDVVFSVYAKQDQRRYVVLAVDTGTTAAATTPAGTNAFSAIFDLQTGTISLSRNTGTSVLTLTSIESVNNGWYRCMVGGKLNTLTTPWNTFPTIAVSDRADYSGTLVTNHYPSYTGVTSNGIGLWGAQYEYNTLTSYVSSEIYQGFANRSAQPVYFYSPEAYDMAYVPKTSSVRIGVQYGAVSTLSGIAVNIPEQLEGTMFVPSSSVVALGTLVDNTTGTAILNAQSLQNAWNTNVNSINLANSIGVRLKNAALLPDIGEQIGSVNI